MWIVDYTSRQLFTCCDLRWWMSVLTIAGQRGTTVLYLCLSSAVVIVLAHISYHRGGVETWTRPGALDPREEIETREGTLRVVPEEWVIARTCRLVRRECRCMPIEMEEEQAPIE